MERYAKAFWEKGPEAFSAGDWERHVKNVEKGERKIEEINRCAGCMRLYVLYVLYVLCTMYRMRLHALYVLCAMRSILYARLCDECVMYDIRCACAVGAVRYVCTDCVLRVRLLKER